MADYTWDDLEALACAWYETFGESMPMGFDIGPAQVPMMRECLRLRSRAPLKAYVEEHADKDF